MKVLHVIDALGVGGGAEHSLAAMLPKLRDRGVESTVVTLIPRTGGLGERLRDEGFDVRVLPGSTWPKRVAGLRRAVRDQSPDLVHATLFNSCLAARVAMIRCDPPLLNSLVNTTYDPVRLSMTDIVPWKMRTMRLVDSITARHLVTQFHALTGAVRAEATDVLGVPGDRVTVIPRGRSREVLGEATPDRRARTRTTLGIDEDTPVFLNVGRQDAQKSQADLIRAFGRVLETHPGSLLLIAGREGDATRSIEAALDEVGAGGSIRLLGHRTDVDDLYVACDVFVFPSSYEGLGCSLLEAMALRIPIIGSDASAIDEVLEHGRLGRVVQRGDIAELAAAMISLVDDDGAREQFAERAAEEFEASYEIEIVADRTVALYQQMAAGA